MYRPTSRTPRCSTPRSTRRTSTTLQGPEACGGFPALAARPAHQALHHAGAALRIRRVGRARRPAGAPDRLGQAQGMIDGALLLDKPVGLTSNRALQDAKRLLQAKKAGHAG